MSALPAAQIHDTEVRIMRSTHVGQDYRISIALPYKYADESEKTYSTVYILDANLYFGMFTDISRMLYLCGLTDTIVVGIGYPLDLPLEETFAEFMALRLRDLTPVVDNEAEEYAAKMDLAFRGSGQAGKFLSFIADDLIPMIETEYRAAASDRTMVGHSFGGLFALYALFHQPALFQRFIVGSPSLHYGSEVAFKYEEAFSKDRDSLPVKLFLCVGAQEETVPYPVVSNMYKLKSQMESRAYDDFEVTLQVFDNCNHCAVVAPMFQLGMLATMPERTPPTAD